MPLGNSTGGYAYAAEYQSSALPWVTSSTAPSAGSPVRYDFDKISRFITLTNLGSTTDKVSIGFTRAGIIGSNKVIVTAGQTVSWEWRVKSVFIQSESGTPQYSLGVGLTSIDAVQMPLLSGTLSDGSPGWNGVG